MIQYKSRARYDTIILDKNNMRHDTPLTIIRGCSPQITSRIIPPNVAVIRPETTQRVSANPRSTACCTPTTQNAANPNASNVQIKFDVSNRCDIFGQK